MKQNTPAHKLSADHYESFSKLYCYVVKQPIPRELTNRNAQLRTNIHSIEKSTHGALFDIFKK